MTRMTEVTTSRGAAFSDAERNPTSLADIYYRYGFYVQKTLSAVASSCKSIFRGISGNIADPGVWAAWAASWPVPFWDGAMALSYLNMWEL